MLLLGIASVGLHLQNACLQLKAFADYGDRTQAIGITHSIDDAFTLYTMGTPLEFNVSELKSFCVMKMTRKSCLTVYFLSLTSPTSISKHFKSIWDVSK